MEEYMGIKRVSEAERVFLKELGWKLVEYRSCSRFSCADMANFAGCSKMHIAEAEKGEARLTIHELRTYCRILHVTPNDILGYNNTGFDNEDLVLLRHISKLKSIQKNKLSEFLSVLNC
jgi:transcriptional regulator with XRE-family HTH domain